MPQILYSVSCVSYTQFYTFTLFPPCKFLHLIQIPASNTCKFLSNFLSSLIICGHGVGLLFCALSETCGGTIWGSHCSNAKGEGPQCLFCGRQDRSGERDAQEKESSSLRTDLAFQKGGASQAWEVTLFPFQRKLDFSPENSSSRKGRVSLHPLQSQTWGCLPRSGCCCRRKRKREQAQGGGTCSSAHCVLCEGRFCHKIVDVILTFLFKSCVCYWFSHHRRRRSLRDCSYCSLMFSIATTAVKWIFYIHSTTTHLRDCV